MEYSPPSVCTYLEPQQVHLYRWAISKSIRTVENVYPQWQSLSWCRPQLFPAESWHYPGKMGNSLIHLCESAWLQNLWIHTSAHSVDPRRPNSSASQLANVMVRRGLQPTHTHTHLFLRSGQHQQLFSLLLKWLLICQQQARSCWKTEYSHGSEMENLSETHLTHDWEHKLHTMTPFSLKPCQVVKHFETSCQWIKGEPSRVTLTCWLVSFMVTWRSEEVPHQQSFISVVSSDTGYTHLQVAPPRPRPVRIMSIRWEH